jgi:exosome complex component RRP4
MDKKIAIPGQFLSDDKKSAGYGTYVKNEKVYSLLYGIVNAKDKISIRPFSGKYIPSRKDFVIGNVIDITPSNWIFDINSPYDGLLHVSEYPKRVDSSQMKHLMNVGDSAILRVKDVNTTMKVELTLRENGLRRITDGRIIEITPTKVPRVIGHGGSMVSLLKKKTDCDVFIGQNGKIWINGKDEDMDRLTGAIDLIIRESHLSGLTDKVALFLKKEYEAGEEAQESTVFKEEGKADQVSNKCEDTPEETCRKIDALLDPSEE